MPVIIFTLQQYRFCFQGSCCAVAWFFIVPPQGTIFIINVKIAMLNANASQDNFNDS